MAIPIVDYVPVQRDPYQIKKPEDASLYADAAMAADVQGESNFLRGTVIQGSQQGAVDPVTGKAPQWQSYTSPGYDPRDKEAIDTMIARGDIKKPADYEKTFGTGAQAPKAPEQKPAEKVSVLSSSDADAYVSDAERQAVEARKRLEDYAKEARGETKNMGYASLLPEDDGNESQTEKDFRKAVEQGGIVGLGAGNALQGYKDANKFRKEAERQQALLDEAQASTKGTAKASEFYSGRSGSAYAADVISKLDRDQAQAQKEFGEQKADIMTQIWNQALGGSYAEAENLKKKADELDAKEAERQAKVAQLKKEAMDLQDRMEKRGAESITDYAKSGAKPTQAQFEMLDHTYFGGVAGTAARKYQAEASEIQLSQAKDKLALATSGLQYDRLKQEIAGDALKSSMVIYDTLTKLPPGMPVQVGNKTYFGMSGAGKVEIDEDGVGRMMTIDQETGRIGFKNLSKIGKAAPGSYSVQYDEVTGEPFVFNNQTGRYVSASDAPVAADRWSQLIPAGTKGGSCGEFVNDLTGLGVQDSLASKVAKCVPGLAADPSSVNVGDTLVQETGQPYGHISIIADKKKTPDGRIQYRLMESNWKGDGRVTFDRTMYADDPRIKGVAATHDRLPSALISETVDEDVKASLRSQGGTPSSVSRGPRKLSAAQKQQMDIQESIAKNAATQGAELLSVEDARGLNVPYGTTRAQAASMGITPEKKTSIDIGDKVNWQKLVRSDPYVEKFPDIERSYNTLQSAYEKAVKAGATGETRAAADQALITVFNKVLDPGSVVREGEYARSEEGQGILTRIEGYAQRLKQGGTAIDDAARKEMVDVANILFQNSLKGYTQSMNFYTQQANELGINPDTFLRRVDLQYLKPKTAPPEGRVWVMTQDGNVGAVLKEKADSDKYIKL